MSRSRSRYVNWLLCGSCLCAIWGCGQERAGPDTATHTEIATGKDSEPQNPVLLVEAQVFVETGGITALALLAQSNVDDYVESVVKRPEHLHAVVEEFKDGRTDDGGELTIDWLAQNLAIREIGSGVVGIGLRADTGYQNEAVSIVNATAESFCKREPERLANEVQRLRKALQEGLARDSSEQTAMVVQHMNRVFDSERFWEMPEIVARATASE